MTQPSQSGFPLQPMLDDETLYENLCKCAGQLYSTQAFSPPELCSQPQVGENPGSQIVIDGTKRAMKPLPHNQILSSGPQLPRHFQAVLSNKHFVR